MQATVRTKGAKPNRSGLLTIVLVFAAGLSLGALVWAGIDEYRADDGNDAAVSAPSVKPSFNLPTDRTVGRSDGRVGNKYPDVYAEPGEPNSVPDYLQQTIQTDRAGWLEQQEPFGAASETRTSTQVDADLGSIGAWAVDADRVRKTYSSLNPDMGEGIVGGFGEYEAELPMAYHQSGMGEGIVGGFGELETDLPMAHHQPGMGEGIVGGFDESVDPGIAQDPVGQPGIGYFA